MASESAVIAEEVERNYLLHKLEEAIDETSKEQSLTSKLFSLHEDFNSLKGMIDAFPGKEELKHKETLYELNNLLSEWQIISKKHGIHEPEALCAAYKLNERLKKIKKELKGGESSTDHGVTPDTTQDQQDITVPPSFPNNLETYRWSSRYKPKKVHGLDDKIRFMERLLGKKESKDGFRTIAIVGMPGVGKTALCQVMFNNEKVKKNYLLRLWVCLSRQPNDDPDSKKEVVKRILKCLGVEDPDEFIKLAGEDETHGLRRLIFALRLLLVGKKYLIVLDDASIEDKCFENMSSESTDGGVREQLAYGLPKGEGSMVIVTTRSEEIAKQMVGEENVHHLPALKKKELCWEIFKDAVEKDGVTTFPRNLGGLRELVVERCVGLPLAATMMGEIMRQRLAEEKKSTQSAAQQQHQTGPIARQHTV